MKTCRWVGITLTLLFCAVTAQAVIKAPYAMEKILSDSTYVVVAKVTTFEPEKKRMILTLTEDLKGKPGFRTVPVLLEGNDEGKKKDHPAILLKRLAADLPVVAFVLYKDKAFTAHVFTNGTWFTLKGAGSAKEAGVWDLTTAEPYLRRTFKGTTEEMRSLVRDNLAGKKKLPGVNLKEKEGFGPEVK